MIKKLSYIIIIFIFCISELKSQEESYTGLDNELGRGYAAISFTFNNIDGNFALFTGGDCGFIIKKYRIGAFFNGLSSKTKVKNENGDKYRFSSSYGGLLFGYEFYRQKSLTFVSNMKFFAGRMATFSDANKYQRNNKTIFYGINPGIFLEYYFNEYFGLSVGIDYKYCFFSDENNFYSKSVMNLPGVVLSLKLGNF